MGLAPSRRLHGAWRQRREHATADLSEVRPDETGTPVGLNRNSSNRTGLTIPLICQRASPGERKNTSNKRETRGRRATARSIAVVAPKLHNFGTSQSAPRVVQPRMRLFVRSIVRHVQRGSSSDAERTKAPSSVASSRCACVLHCAPCQGRRGAGVPSGLVEGAPALARRRTPHKESRGSVRYGPEGSRGMSSAREGPARALAGSFETDRWRKPSSGSGPSTAVRPRPAPRDPASVHLDELSR